MDVGSYRVVLMGESTPSSETEVQRPPAQSPITHDRDDACQNLATKSSFPYLHPSVITGAVTIRSRAYAISTCRIEYTVGGGEEGREGSRLGR